MGEPTPGTPPSAKLPDDRLDSWKEIAAYLNRDVTTVQRWEKREGMPVHRHLHDRMGSVYAFKSDLAAWARSRKPPSSPENDTSAHCRRIPRRRVPPGGAVSLNMEDPVAVGRCCRASDRRGLRLQKSDYFWRNPIAEAQFQTVTDSEGMGQAAAVSRDGQFVAFLSDQDGKMDVWVTQVGSGVFHNLTRGQRTGTRQSIGSDSGVLARWRFRHFLGSKVERIERRRHQHMGRSNVGWTAQTIS